MSSSVASRYIVYAIVCPFLTVVPAFFLAWVFGLWNGIYFQSFLSFILTPLLFMPFAVFCCYLLARALGLYKPFTHACITVGCILFIIPLNLIILAAVAMFFGFFFMGWNNQLGDFLMQIILYGAFPIVAIICYVFANNILFQKYTRSLDQKQEEKVDPVAQGVIDRYNALKNNRNST